MADAPMAIQGMRRSDKALRAATRWTASTCAWIPGSGVGVGLSVSYGIVAAHGGSLRLADGSPGATKFVVELPAARWQPEAGGPRRATESRETAQRVPSAAPTSS